MWCGVVWCGVVQWGVVWCGVAWCSVVWCGVVWHLKREVLSGEVDDPVGAVEAQLQVALATVAMHRQVLNGKKVESWAPT